MNVKQDALKRMGSQLHVKYEGSQASRDHQHDGGRGDDHSGCNQDYLCAQKQ